MIPQTDFILVRGPRTDITGNPTEIVLSVQRNNGKFDFSDSSFLRTKPNSKDLVEEWVPTKELHLYKKAFGVGE